MSLLFNAALIKSVRVKKIPKLISVSADHRNFGLYVSNLNEQIIEGGKEKQIQDQGYKKTFKLAVNYNQPRAIYVQIKQCR